MEKYDLILAGTGFASTFFLMRYLEKRPKDRILVLERGKLETHAWKLQNRQLMDVNGPTCSIPFQSTYRNLTPEKPWVYTPSVGGSSNCWYACTPRFMPSDFKLRTNFGVGVDWPIGYQDVEPYYEQVDEIMSIAGPSDHSPFPRSKPYPQPAHNMNDVDRALMKAYPDTYFVMPAARPTRPTSNRPRCCASGVCNLCPVDAKFTILNEMFHLYKNPNVELRTESPVLALKLEGGRCTGVHYQAGGKQAEASADVVALGANPIFNSHILLSSGLKHPWLGTGLSEQIAFSCSIDLRGLDNFSGSTVATGHGYMLYDGPHRKDRAACLIENINVPRLRPDPGRYRQRAYLKFIFEDIPSEKGRVSLTENPLLPSVEFHGFSDYVAKAIAETKQSMNKLLGALPIESIEIQDIHPTEGHILGTARMAAAAEEGVVDADQVLHQCRNVLCLGGSSFPSVSPANPTITIAALSLRSADNFLGGSA